MGKILLIPLTEITDTHVTDISNSVVGILKRARTRGVVHFVGQSAPDMLYQGTDDEVIIELIS